MDYEEVKSYLYGLLDYGRSYGVDRMWALTQVLDYPEQAFPVIHVAGTNGKGSVCAMLEAIYRRQGYRTGLFTSPHLVRLEERIQVAGKMIPTEDLVAYVESLKDIGDDLARKNPEERPSMFELMNAIGFLYFKKAKIDIGIIETGLGGRFDSTNVVDPEVAVITSISYDHTDILGESLEEIAFAKAGIIKAKKPVVIGPMVPEVEALIRKAARELEAEVFSVEEVFGKDIEAYPKVNLHGNYQRTNAAVALLVARVLKAQFPIDEELIGEALMEVNWPGRWQTIQVGKYPLILDCAHNAEGAVVLEENLKLLIAKEGKKPAIIVGSLSRDRAKPIMEVIAKYADTIILVKLKNSRALEVKVLKALVPEEFEGEVLQRNIEAIFPRDNVIEMDANGRSIVATGSIYLIGEIMERIMVGPAGFEPATKGL